MDGNVIVGNPAGGITCRDSSIQSSNNVVYHNAGARLAGGTSTIISYNDTFCDQEVAGIAVEHGSLYVTNTILAHNRTAQIQLASHEGTVCRLRHCLVAGGKISVRQGSEQITMRDTSRPYFTGRGNIDAAPRFRNDAVKGEAKFVTYNQDGFSTRFALTSKVAGSNDWVGRPVKIGPTWSVIKAVHGHTVEVMGDLRPELAGAGTMTMLIPRTYHLSPDSPCIDRGRSLGAPARDRDGQPRPIHHIAPGKVDIGADELLPQEKNANR